MIEAYMLAAALVGWCGALAFSFYIAVERSPLLGFSAMAVLMVIGLGAALSSVAVDNQQGPCVEYETRMGYNPATKLSAPYRVCVERGEWIEE